MDHANPAMVPGHEHINIAIHGIPMISAPDDFRDSLCLATHIMKLGQIVEIMETVDAQHKPSSFSTNVLRPW